MVMKHFLCYVSITTHKQHSRQEVSKLLFKISMIDMQACKFQLKSFSIIMVIGQLG